MQVKQGRAMLPTGESEVYPFHGLFGCVQMLVLVGMGTQEVVEEDGFALVVVGLAVDEAAGQVYTEVE